MKYQLALILVVIGNWFMDVPGAYLGFFYWIGDKIKYSHLTDEYWKGDQ